MEIACLLFTRLSDELGCMADTDENIAASRASSFLSHLFAASIALMWASMERAATPRQLTCCHSFECELL